MRARSSITGRAWALWLLATALGCQPRLEQVWELRGFRILGVRSDPPEVERGARVRLELVSADVRERAVQVVWFVCTLPVSPSGGGDAGADAAWSRPQGALGGCPPDALQFAFGPSATITVPPAGGSLDAQGREVLNVIGFACAGGTIGVPEDGGVQPTCTAPAGSSEPAQGWLFTHSVFVRPSMPLGPANNNPTISEVRFAGMTLSEDAPVRVPRCTDPSSRSNCPSWRFEVLFASGSREQYSRLDPVSGVVQSAQERLTTGYVIEAGTLSGGFRADTAADPESRMPNDWRAPAEPGTYRVYVYAFDGRGGFDWARRSVVVE